ncbi:MAG: hypothetical protein BroJett030_23300 [Alphaproteobacteria bacterium]|nr:MAG: hypothetical protein BroJett030_23300 [Alphaproteobacteria bacterium]
MAGEEREEMPAAPRQAAWALALAGLLPLVLIAVAMALTGQTSGWFGLLTDAFRTWSAVTLAFLGGIRWGAALQREPLAAAFAVAVIPAVAGWLALFAPGAVGVGILLVGHCAQGAWDSLSASRQALARWFGEMRTVATLAAAAAHVVALVTLL